jgi:hypothetical protein
MKILNFIEARAKHNNIDASLIKDTFGVDVQPNDYTTVQSLANAIHAEIVGTYFNGANWQPDYNLNFSYQEVIDFIKADQQQFETPVTIFDVGCGANQFKTTFPNTIGLDPFFEGKADIVCPIEQYVTHNKYRHVLALGSINFGEWDRILIQMCHTVALIEDGGFLHLRFNPGIRHDGVQSINAISDWIEWFPWSQKDIENVANIFNLEIQRNVSEKNRYGHERIYVRAQKRGK